MFHVEHNFNNILGSDLIKRSMTASVARGRISHAYIICGEAGFGKRALAQSFAKAILCYAPTGGHACGICASCKTFESGNNPDLVVIAPIKASLGVDEMRDDIIANLSVLPFASSKRVYIIEQAHKMTHPAQNAMLLSLEDGPKHAVFLLLANHLGAFLPTLLSRCISYKIPPLPQNAIEEHLRQRGISPEKAQIGAWFSGGGIGRALALAQDEDFMELRRMALELARSAAQMSIPEIFAAAKNLEEHKDNIHDFLDILKLHYRDELISTLCPRLLAKIRAIDDTKEKLARNCPFLLCMEILLLKLL
ncbi:MAG: DNA polymerase III subunit [Clostridiales bacterium]|jgi:DNA polymerase-3 subunit delta'|nr:DNA polymerase III subunit [Clostridiales bacterium]